MTDQPRSDEWRNEEGEYPPDIVEEPGSMDRFADALMGLLATIPDTTEPESDNPMRRARDLTRRASLNAGAFAAGLSLPVGPMGWLTVLPDLVGVWRIQSQLIADIAAAYGKSVTLTREQMLYCLFRHAAAQAVRDLLVRTGHRILVRRAGTKVWRRIIQGVGTRLGGRIAGRGLARWLPLVGAAGVGGYAYYDTWRVGQTAMDIFCREIEVEPPLETDSESEE